MLIKRSQTQTILYETQEQVELNSSARNQKVVASSVGKAELFWQDMKGFAGMIENVQ